MNKSQVVAVASLRAGTGKTTTAIHLGHTLALAAQSVLLVDLDPTGPATQALGVSPSNSGLLLRIALGEASPAQIGLLVRSLVAGLDFIPADISSAHDEPHDRGVGLRAGFAAISDQYPWILLDCPPLDGFWLRTALEVADSVLVPAPPRPTTMAGAEEIDDLTRRLRADGSPGAQLRWVVPTAVDWTDAADREGLERLAIRFPRRVTQTSIPRDPALAAAVSQGTTVLESAPESRSARSFIQLARELMTHGG